MPITVKCPSCQKDCQIQDEYAAMMVRCPSCGNIIPAQRPGDAAATAPTAQAPAGGAPPGPAVLSPAPTAPSGPGFAETVNLFAQQVGLTALQKNLVFAGMGCLLLMVVFSFLPWASGGTLAIGLWQGVFNFLLSFAAGAFLLVSAMLKSKELFHQALIAAAVWGEHASFWRLIDIATISPLGILGIGMVLTLLVSLGTAVTFGLVVVQRWSSKA